MKPDLFIKGIRKRLDLRLGRLRSPDIELDAESLNDVTFAFLGEFGFGLTSWVPYVKFLSEKFATPICTAGIDGSAFLYGFSRRHTEVPGRFGGDMWGVSEKYVAAQRRIGTRLVHPVNERVRKISVGGIAWENPIFHRTLKTDHYSVVHCASDSAFFEKRRKQFGEYVVINNKHYFNWAGIPIPNFYNVDEIDRICAFAEANGLNVVLNVFDDPVVDLVVNQYFSLDYSQLKSKTILNLSSMYRDIPTKAEQNRFQAAVLKGAQTVFATQGGNAPLSIACNRSVSVLLRGGNDYPDLVSLAGLYDCKLELFIALEHVLRDRQSHLLAR